MSSTITKDAEQYLETLADELAISEARYEQAQASYESFGRHLHREGSTIRKFQPQVYVQGSFRLGTAIRPISEEEDYDVDAMCELRALQTSQLSQKKLKELLGVEVKSYHAAKKMTNPVREGRRCWALNYADGAQFHMDIVPALPNAQRIRLLIETAGHGATWADTAVGITDNERENYAQTTDDWPRSNPKGYAEWFKLRMGTLFETRRRQLAEKVTASVEDIPIYRVRTPLQSAIIILKRHRDSRFNGKLEDRPISIILTTLAAHSYSNESTIGEALVSILSRMRSHVHVVNGKYVIANPTDPLENFADKWEDHPQRATAFFSWLDQAQKDFTELAKMAGVARIAETASGSMGKIVTERVIKRASSPGGLTRVASVAPVGGVAFENTPRIPTEPKGFA
ncbi:MAG: nucleotidyltransferase [Hyphomonas sp.]|uniref:nucleotidyltransferase domain-containing protein n=1 Tax=Hyphomonas sp. TaxID=87 RepID=UPI0017A1C0B0|nr:nucleotidyltransferase [Hyphomonas sp.]MBA3068111.1 nucleotidyltransferase [Hyphomonas sp.]MBU3922440.1 nucleotidyltransferase [Alphaproteobacteria bacterium]MBU4061463.1 nucleotidyltransferase [Alphaproteobacteria bacterium]MBU4165031.1 nucleotidyltransferase [Alphaproteobacteria bacterium]